MAGARASEHAALARALDLARRGPVGRNPRVGAVVLGGSGAIVGEGWHRGAGTPHAEVAALASAGTAARGGTVVVTLEPCAHTGRTPPCTEALLAAGVRRVVYARPDHTQRAAGGAAALTRAGVTAELADDDELRDAANDLVARWQEAVDLGRPVVTWKFAATLDGRVAAADGSSRWITSAAARADVHAERSEHDVVLIGTGTAIADDPELTARPVGPTASAPHQPQRAVMGRRDLPAGSRVLTGHDPALQLRTRDPHAALAELWAAGYRDVWLEGGPTIAAAFWRAGLVDHVVAYLAPALLGSGAAAVGDLGATSIADIARLTPAGVRLVGADIRIDARPSPTGQTAATRQAMRQRGEEQPECSQVSSRSAGASYGWST